MRSPVMRSPSFHSPFFLSNSTRSNRFRTLRLPPNDDAVLRLGCCDIMQNLECFQKISPDTPGESVNCYHALRVMARGIFRLFRAAEQRISGTAPCQNASGPSTQDIRHGGSCREPRAHPRNAARRKGTDCGPRLSLPRIIGGLDSVKQSVHFWRGLGNGGVSRY